MKFKIGQYRKAHEKFVRERYFEAGIDSLALYSAVSSCPILAVYWFCREVDSDNKELTRRIVGVKLFYGVVEVEE